MSIESLARIGAIAEKLLPNGVVIAGNVYRPFDMSPFGREGFSLTLYQAPKKMIGINFGVTEPSNDKVEAEVKSILIRLAA